MESFFVWGHLDTFVDLELALVASIVNMIIFDDGVLDIEYLSTQLSYACVIWVLVCTFIEDFNLMK